MPDLGEELNVVTSNEGMEDNAVVSGWQKPMVLTKVNRYATCYIPCLEIKDQTGFHYDTLEHFLFLYRM
jgi:hypothetical protein